MDLRKLFLLMTTGLIITGCATDTTDAPADTGTADIENVEDAEIGSEDAVEITATIDILIDGEVVADLSKEVTVPEGTYLLDVMHEEYDVVDDGGFLSAIGGYEQDIAAERYWMYYTNDEMPSVGAAEYELEAGDQIEWRLEDSEY